MADQPQTPRVGVVGAQANQPGAPAQQAAAPAPAPAPGLPGVQQPPVPSPEQIAKIVAEQQRVVQQQVQQSQKQAGYSGENAQAAAPAETNNRFSQQPAQQPAAQQPAPAPAPAQSNQAVSQIPANIAAQMPPQMTQQQPDQPAAQSPIPGLSEEQVLAGPPQPQALQPVYQQPQPPPQPVYQGQPPPPQQFAPQQVYQQPAPQQQFAPQAQQAQQAQQARPSGIAAYAQPQAVDKPTVPWYPVRGKGKSVDIELSDVILKNVPSDFPTGESNAAAKVVLALFSEILALKDQVQFLMENQQNPQSQLPPDLLGRVYNLERTLFEQKQSLSSRARGVQDQIAMGQAKGHTPEQILATLQGQSAGAAQMVQSGAQPAAAHTTTEQQPAAQAAQAAAAGQAAPDAAATEAEPASE